MKAFSIPQGPVRLAVVLSHPTQYYSPWFQYLAREVEGLELKVFYLWNFGVTRQEDRKFGAHFSWDIDLLAGYDHDFVPNRSGDPGTHHFRGLDNPGVIAALARFDPDAVLLFGYTYASHLRIILQAGLRRWPLLFRGDSHRLADGSGRGNPFRGLVRRMLFGRFRAFLFVGEANRDFFCTCGVPERKLFFAPHSIDNGRFAAAQDDAEAGASQWREELGIPANEPVLLFAGKFEEKKRPALLVEAFRRACGDRGHLLMVGSGKLEPELRTAAEGDSRIHFQPFQNQSAMPRVYATGDLLVLPSEGRGETWGLAVNECMVMRRPALVSSHVGCGPDLIESGRTGWVFEAGNREDLERVIDLALESRQALLTMGRNAASRIERYSYRETTAGLIRALDNVVSS